MVFYEQGLSFAVSWISMAKQNKSYLDSKICPVCKRPFTWRKKWEKNWQEIVYCSKKCRRNKKENINV